MMRGTSIPFVLRAALCAGVVGTLLLAGLRAQPSVETAHNPIAEFRQWLALPEAEQAKILEDKPERTRRALEEKLKEYAALEPEERESKLMALEIRWFMRPLMGIAPSNRVEHLARIPETHRSIINDRLQHWDLLPPGAQKELLGQELTLNYFSRANGGVMGKPMGRAERLALVPHPDRKRFEQKLDLLRALPPEQRDEMARKFEQFFTLSDSDRRRALHTLGDAERKEMEETLAAFERLPLEQRRACIQAFGKFARMTPAERGQFLRNVERWQDMSSEDRAAWRALVKALPPLPPGMNEMPPPPMPPNIGPPR